MHVTHVDLYEHFHLERPAGGAGRLTCYVQESTAEVSRNRRRPAVLVLPGGAYCFVSAREAEPVALRFLGRGYQAFVLDYSVAPLRFPTALREAAMAMCYIRQQFPDCPVAAIGFSAGGHLCGTLGLMFDCPEVSDIGQPQVIRPDALGLCYPVTLSWGRTHEGTFQALCGDDMQLRQRLSLDAQVRPDAPPVFLWHTRDDDAVPCRNSLILAQKLDEAGVDICLHLYHRGWHGLSTADGQVYSSPTSIHASADVPGWVETMIHFFSDVGLKIQDLP